MDKCVYLYSHSGATVSYELAEDMTLVECTVIGALSENPTLVYSDLSSADAAFDQLLGFNGQTFTQPINVPLTKGTKLHFAPSFADGVAYLHLRDFSADKL